MITGQCLHLCIGERAQLCRGERLNLCIAHAGDGLCQDGRYQIDRNGGNLLVTQ